MLWPATLRLVSFYGTADFDMIGVADYFSIAGRSNGQTIGTIVMVRDHKGEKPTEMKSQNIERIKRSVKHYQSII